MKKENLPAGFPLHSNGFAYVAEDKKYYLKDNGKLDGDPREGAFAIEISTRNWKEGATTFAFFASIRPATGPFVAARRDFAVVVKEGRVVVEDLGDAVIAASQAIASFSVEPTTVEAGQKISLRAHLRGASVAALQLTDPYYIAERDTLPGFRFDAAKKKSLLAVDRKPDSDSIVLELDTRGWPAGVRHFVANAVGQSGRSVDYRNFAIKVRGPRDRFRVTVEASSPFAAGTHFEKFVQLRDGTLLCAEKFSTDGGRTWQGDTGGFGVGGVHLKNGRVVGFAYRCLPIEGREGWYVADRFVSSDNGRRFDKSRAEFHVPEAKAAMGHALHLGPLFMRSIIERGDGSLAAFMAGWFKSDEALCPYGKGRPYSRSYVCESSDGGRTWRYLTTIAYAHIGSEGYNEGSMRRLPNGEWLAVMRTGNANDFNCQDNPIMWSVSRDEGATWSEPARTGVAGAFPSLAVLPDGVAVMSYGRPGAMIAFSADGGRTWTDPTCVDATPGSGYTDVVGVGPGELLVGFGAQNFLDPTTGERDSMLRLARVRYERETARKK
ncbi:exo-alpha-sialidase [Candidatus Sumerlaeota bacterium]|nr:exo-alpha-sialidase [Candidatus Sumerlaeota bacterium]